MKLKMERRGQDNENDRQVVFELIRRVGTLPLIYNANDKDFYDPDLVKDAWNKVADGLVFGNKVATVTRCQRKWKNLRDYYVRKKRFQQKNPRLRIKWVYFSAMDAVLKNFWDKNERTNFMVANANDVVCSGNLDKRKRKCRKRTERKEVFELIRRVASKRHLYDASLKEYNNHNLLKEAWEAVADGLILNNEIATDEACQKKWKNLRDYYVRLKQSGKRKWVYFSAIDAVFRNVLDGNEGTLPDMNWENSEMRDDVKNESLPVQHNDDAMESLCFLEDAPTDRAKLNGIEKSAKSMTWYQRNKLRRKRRLLNQKKTKSSSVASSNSNGSRCLLCLNETSNLGIGPEILSENVRAIFILKRLLGVSNNELTSLFAASDGENPHKWIAICGNCSPLVESAELINEQIISLEKTLDGFKRKCLERIKNSCEGNIECIVCMETVCMCQENLKLTRRIRNSILKRSALSPWNADSNVAVAKELESGSKAGLILKSEVTDLDLDGDTCDFSIDDSDMNFDEDFSSMHLPEISSEPERDHLESSRDIRESASQGLQLGTTTKSLKTSKSKLHVPVNTDVEDDNGEKSLEDIILENIPKCIYQCPSCHHLPLMELDSFIVHILFHFRHPNRCRECNMYLSDAPTLIERHFKEYLPSRFNKNQGI